MSGRALLTMLIAVLLAIPALADFKVEKGIAQPDEFPAAFKDLVEAQGVRVLNDAGAAYVEIWLSKGLAGEAKAAGDDTIYTGVPGGSFLGVWRFVGNGSDFRGQAIKPGFYSMRLGLMPLDGNHLGASNYRDFVLLVPPAVDTNPNTPLAYDDTISLSRKASGTGHPGVFPLVVPENVSAPVVARNDNSWVLKTKIGLKSGSSMPFAVTVFGKADH